jgi:hypothetical protein
MSRKSRAVTYPEPLGSPQPVAGDLYLYLTNAESMFTRPYIKISFDICEKSSTIHPSTILEQAAPS